jgi:hypothetical protein
VSYVEIAAVYLKGGVALKSRWFFAGFGLLCRALFTFSIGWRLAI